MSNEAYQQWAAEYAERFKLLREVDKDLEALFDELVAGLPRIDRVSTRVKPVDRFAEKAVRTVDDGEELSYKYEHPLEDIQDQIGARIVVYYRSDVDPIADRVLAELRVVEDREIEEPDPQRFGYESRHFVCFIPPDIRERHEPPIDFFELQIATLFQHAWAEANHDLGYKAQWELDWEEKRRIAWAAAQAWGADRIFDDLWRAQARAEDVTE